MNSDKQAGKNKRNIQKPGFLKKPDCWPVRQITAALLTHFTCPGKLILSVGEEIR
jgi:hypothetical protein